MAKPPASSKPGPTPIRRSARLSSAGDPVDAAALSRLQSAATTNTPGRAGNRRKGALPKVKARTSHAYGASGRIGAAEQLIVPPTGFAQALNAQRGQAVGREGNEESDEVDHPSTYGVTEELAAHDTAPGDPSNEVTEQFIQQSIEHEHSEINRDMSETPSHIDTSKSFGMVREAGMISGAALSASLRVSQRPAQDGHPAARTSAYQRPPVPNAGAIPTQPFALRTRSANLRRPEPAPQGIHSSPPPSQNPTTGHRGNLPANDARASDVAFNGFEHLRPARLFANPTNLYRIIIACVLLLGAIVFAMVIRSPYTGMSGALISRAAYTWDGVTGWIQPPVQTSGLPKSERITAEQAFGKPVEMPYGYMWDRMNRCEDKAEEYDEKYENYDKAMDTVRGRCSEIESSIERIKTILPNTIVVNKNKDGELVVPDEFWRAIWTRMNSDDVDWHEFIMNNQRKFLDLLNSGGISSSLYTQFRPLLQSEFVTLMEKEYEKMSGRIEKMVAAAVKSTTSRAIHDQIRIESLAFVNLAANSEINLRKVNHFSPGLGAHIDPYRTSSTFVDKSSRSTSVYRKLFSSQSRRPPIVALEHWQEPGDCWCAAPDDKEMGLAQLAVNLAHPTIPRQVTVEHLPKQASLEFGSAPKDMELWVQSEEEVDAQAGCDQGPSGWICLGRFSYNVHGANHVQTFTLDGVLKTPITKTMVRVKDNWGAGRTCLYRVRLHGESD